MLGMVLAIFPTVLLVVLGLAVLVWLLVHLWALNSEIKVSESYNRALLVDVSVSPRIDKDSSLLLAATSSP